MLHLFFKSPGPQEHAPIRCRGCKEAFTSGIRLYGTQQRPYCEDCAQDLPHCRSCQGPTDAYAHCGDSTHCCHCHTTLQQCSHCGLAGMSKFEIYDNADDAVTCECCREIPFGACLQCGESSSLCEMGYCNLCLETAVNDPAGALENNQEVTDFLERELSMSVTEDFDFHLVGKDILPSDIQGQFRNYGPESQIFVREGLPQSTYQSVFAHELAHAWQNEHCPEQSNELSEGFARWIETRVLHELYWDHAVQRNKTSTLPDYGSGYRKCLRWVELLGEEGLLEAVQFWEDFPDFPESVDCSEELLAA